MNILNVTTTSEWRGGEAQLYQYFKLLEEYQDLNQMILCPKNSVLSKKCESDKSKHFTYKKTSKIFSLIKPIINICISEKIDILHIHDSNALTASLICSLLLPKKTKIVLSRKRNNPIKDKFLNRYKYSHPKIHKIISVSKAVEKIFDSIIKDKERLVTIYDSIDVNFFKNTKKKYLIHREYDLPYKTKIIGNVAALTHQKDIHTFLNTAQKIIKKNNNLFDIKFVLIGDGPLKQELLEYAKTIKIEKQLIFMGQRSNIHELLVDLDVFLLTSETEGLPLTIYEAFASRVPVVTTNAGGVAEVIKNGETGFVTDLKDSENLCKYVLEILENQKLSENIKSNAYKLVIEQHDLSNMKNSYYSFYKSIN
ncbi:glycosyltransferase family 4 protein [Flavobacterium sp. UMI-01]|uniref:glycosyltransferase family 4 protein n=1 Tax=Flavobacterium sp. UMI-01 TaxID=1441053 RepID=UPI001C7D3B4E|nr:glycosyltransferase family 4 protein [Flavobacterium sp. UMI-01]GIZ08725.1 glycosyl transferase [Flavobacterium sp. UMI-01]